MVLYKIGSISVIKINYFINSTFTAGVNVRGAPMALQSVRLTIPFPRVIAANVTPAQEVDNKEASIAFL